MNLLLMIYLIGYVITFPVVFRVALKEALDLGGEVLAPDLALIIWITFVLTIFYPLFVLWIFVSRVFLDPLANFINKNRR